jgi:hypothetical protein
MSTRPVLDLTKNAFVRELGDITVFGTWYGEHKRPALVLLATASIGKPNVVPCVVQLQDAWRWSREHGDVAYHVQQSMTIAHLLGLTAHNRYTCMRITTLIQDHLQDLKDMPLKPSERAVVADAFLTDRYGKVRHTEVSDDV